ncbi:hypothetical protein K438DRAFT_1789332 [Mycena galopus ATCC 62051]|nr:hypothetical protein K438DRAFT_1789332 [Mycena galopus ATCC 62051]
MTSTPPTRPARNHQVSSRIPNNDNSVGLSAAAQNLLSSKPIIDLVKKIAKLTLFLPETVPLATEEDEHQLISSSRTRQGVHKENTTLDHPIFKRKTSLEIVCECQAQLEACWQGEAPFHALILNDNAMEWWENLEIGYSPCSGVLAMLAVHIFGILANSMPDERTNSNITWFNSPLRGNQKAENLLDMILGVGVRRPRRNPTVAFRRLNPELLEKVKHKAADHSNSDSETDSDSDKESNSPTVVTQSVPSNTIVSAPAVGEEPSHSEDEEADRIRRRYHRKKRAAKTKWKKKVFPSHTKFVVDPDINLH